MKILIVDGHSLAHRAFHAINIKLNAPDGTPTGMITGFFNMLFKVCDEFKPDYKLIAFDAGGKNFRHEIYTEYKSTRKPLDDDIKIQLPILQELLKFWGCYVLSVPNVEADDIIGSAAKIIKNSGHEVAVLSSDKDLLQILDDEIIMIRPTINGISQAEIYDQKKFISEYGFKSNLMADYLALTGDKSDNIPGVKGIGEVGAKKLISEFGSIENIYNSLDKVQKNLRSKLEKFTLNDVLEIKKLTQLNLNVLDEKKFLHELFNAESDLNKFIELASGLRLNRVLKKINPEFELQDNFTEYHHEYKLKYPAQKIITCDLKNELLRNPNLNINDVFDLRTAYYLLHPDVAGKKFDDVNNNIKNSNEPGNLLLKTAARLNNEIDNFKDLRNVMEKIDKPILPILNKMASHGIKINMQHFKNLNIELEARVKEIETTIINLTGLRININSPQQVSWLLFEKLNYVPSVKKGKSFSTEANVLEKLTEYPNDVPSLILEHRELSKMLNSFVIPFMKYADENNIIHPNFEASSTGTGRLSCHDPNLQTIPAAGKWAEKIKAGLIPVEPENIFISADYSQIELRVLAFLSGEKKLIEAFKNNTDVHTETASWVFGVSSEFVTQELRRTAKMINFGLLYGMKSFGLAERLNISRAEAKTIIEKYFKAFPGINEFIKNIVMEAKTKGYTQTFSGRIRPVNEIPAKGLALDRALINSPVQGTAADIARIAMINFSGSKFSDGLFLQVHDSLICECSRENVNEAGEILSDVMKDVYSKKIPLEVVIKSGESLADV